MYEKHSNLCLYIFFMQKAALFVSIIYVHLFVDAAYVDMGRCHLNLVVNKSFPADDYAMPR